ncbi:2-hydroxyacid dehydrogenase [Candidatus Bathyarchaeota archaeon]|nr:2-hydroxyacid dehydrogenase [Candidatus Bathyarchaeota archaeon]
MLKILAIDLDELFLKRLSQHLPRNCRLIIPSSSDEEELLHLVGDIDIIVSLKVSGKVIKSAPKLKMIQSIGSGVDGIDIDAATEKEVIVCSTTGLNAIPAAEHVTALMLALAKNITKYDRMLRNQGWLRMPSTLLNKKTLGVVGLGSIGMMVVRRSKPFGMKVLAIKRRPSEELRLKLRIDFLGGKDDLTKILRESDFIVLSLPLTAETRKLIGERELRMMKKTAYLVNVSRGEVVDEEALIKILKEGVIAGAGLDIFNIEPINSDNPLLRLENVVFTPHVAGGVLIEEIVEERAKFIVQNIKRLLKGQKPEKIVDPILKYVITKH